MMRNTHERFPQEKGHKIQTQVNSLFHDTNRKGYLLRVKRFLSQGLVDVNSRSEKHGKTLLMVAAQEGHRKLFDFLVSKGANASLVDENGDNVLHMACRGGRMAIVKYIVKNDSVDINSKGMHGSTSLLQTVYCGHMHVLRFLLTKEANVSHLDNEGENILHVACRGGHLNMVKYVLSLPSVDINSRECYGETPLMKAASEGHIDVFVFIVTSRADVHLLDDDGDNILHHASIGGHANIVQFIVSHKLVDINSRGKDGMTPLMRVAYYGHKKVFYLFMREGGETKLVDDRGYNILHLAALSGQVEMVKIILSLTTVDINSRTHTGQTPLMTAAYEGHKDVFEFLLSKGANVSYVDDKGDNILHHASYGGHTEMVQYILSQDLVNINIRGKYGATPLMKAVLRGHINVFKYLMRMKANVSLVDSDGDSILHYASIGEHTKMVQHVLSLEQVDINSRGKHGRTALMRAAFYGHRKVVDLLVSKGGLTNLVDAEGHSMLHLASLGGRLEMVKYILSQNMADINARDEEGDTAAMVAKRKGKLDVYNFLVSKGCAEI
ncbi:ankyrin repeat domain-containing protein 50-like [Haliotis asinina]|uniref:ankyrin repeat domain-containing protein 50-like n=1 Tax=Haliotis asinina TaxID=109174 RepID=UPI0035319B9F